MKISTAQFFKANADSMSRGQSKVSDIQAKLGSGKVINSPSEDTTKANTITKMEAQLEKLEVYASSMDVAKTRLTSEESVLSSLTEVFQRLSELAIQGANGTMASEDRSVLAAEVSELRKEVFRLGNTKDLDGNYLFSGNRIDAPSFIEDANGSVVYNGDFGRLSVNVSDSREISVNTLGNELLSSDDFDALKKLEEGLRNDDIDSIRGSVDSLKMVSDRLSVSFGQMAGRFAAINTQSELNEEVSVRITTLLSQTRDLDYATAVTELSRETLALQALQASFTRISQLTLFNFLR